MSGTAAAANWRDTFCVLLRLDIARARGFLRQPKVWRGIVLLALPLVLGVAMTARLHAVVGHWPRAITGLAHDFSALGWGLAVWLGLLSGVTGFVTLSQAELRHVLAGPVPARAFVALDILRGLILVTLLMTGLIGVPATLFVAASDPHRGLAVGLGFLVAPGATVLIGATVDLALLRLGWKGLRPALGVLLVAAPLCVLIIMREGDGAALLAARDALRGVLVQLGMVQGVPGPLVGVALLSVLALAFARLFNHPRLDLRERGRTHAAMTDSQAVAFGASAPPGTATSLRPEAVRVRQRVPRLPWLGGAGPFLALRLAGLRNGLHGLGLALMGGVMIPRLASLGVVRERFGDGVGLALLVAISMTVLLTMRTSSPAPSCLHVLVGPARSAPVALVLLGSVVAFHASLFLALVGPSFATAALPHPTLSEVALPLLGLEVALASLALRASLDHLPAPGTLAASPFFVGAPRITDVARAVGTVVLVALPPLLAGSAWGPAGARAAFTLACWAAAGLGTWRLVRRFARQD